MELYLSVSDVLVEYERGSAIVVVVTELWKFETLGLIQSATQ